MKELPYLRKFLKCTSKATVGNDCLLNEFAKGVIEGAVACLMGQGASYERAWEIVQYHLHEHIGKYAIPNGWKFT